MDYETYEEKLRDYAADNILPITQKVFEDADTSSADNTSDLLDAEKNQVVKTILFKNAETGDLYAVIVRATEMVDRQKIKEKYGVDNLEMTDPESIVELIGYPVGGVPPFGFENAEFILDTDIKKEETVWAGGGSPRALIRFTVKDLIRVIEPDQLDVKKTETF